MDGPTKLDHGCSQVSLVSTAPAFVGRQQELDGVERTLREVSAGHPRVVLIAGDTGIGKTQLLQEIRSIALRHGMQVYSGRCYEDLAIPYLPFVETWYSLLEQLPGDVERILGADAEVMGQFLHWPGLSSSAATPLLSAETDQDKLRLFLTVSRATIHLAQDCPTLFAVDDLHWADRASLELFRHLVYTVADRAMREPIPLLLIGTYRPVGSEAHLGRMLARLQREPLCQTLVLSSLTQSEVHAFIRSMGLVNPSHQLTTVVHEATQGNPLFIQEVFHHLVRQHAFQERGGYLVTSVSAADLQLPDQVTGAIVARTQGLSRGCQESLTLAAFLGDRFTLQVLGVVSGMGEDELLSLLEEGTRQRLLLSEGQAFRFAHPLIRHVFYTEPSAARRQRIHQRIASTLEGLYAGDLDGHILEIAHHLVRAGVTAEADTMARYARRAGDQAFTVFAWGAAAHYYAAALSAAESTGRLSVHDRAELHYWAGLAHARDQDVGPSLDHYEKAMAAYQLAGNVRGLAQVLIEKTRLHFTLASVPYGTLVDVRPLEEVLEALGDGEPGLRGGIMAIMSQVYWTARQTDKAQEMAQRALEIGQRLTDDRLCARASLVLALAQIQSLHVREAFGSYQTALRAAQRVNDLWLQGWPLQRMPLALLMLGRLEEAEATALEACALSRQTQDWGDYSVALSALVSLAVARGDFEAAASRAQETLLMVSRSHYPWGGARALYAMTGAHALRGAWAEAEEALDMLVEPGRVFQQVGPVIQACARTFRQLLRAQVAADHDAMESSGADLIRVAGLDSYSLAPFCALVEIGDLMEVPTVAEQPYQVLSVAAQRGVLFSTGWVFLIPRVLGVAAALNRCWDRAEAHFRTAIEVATRVGARPELGRACLDYARMLAARSAGSDRHRAIELLQQAGPIFDEVGMEPFARRVVQLAEALQTYVPRLWRPGTAYPDPLSAQEVEVLVQITQGQTNREIADDLGVSSQTVARRVRGIFTKIGVKSRTAAAAYALETGLASRRLPRQRAAAPPAMNPAGAGGKTPRPDVLPHVPQPLRIMLVTDLVGSTALIERLGDAATHRLLRIHNSIIRDCLRRHHGAEVTHTGDGVEASFASPSSAVACAVAIQRAFAEYNRAHPSLPLHVRVGVNAGEPIPTEGRLFGSAVHATFRICARARPDQILVSDVIRRLATGKDFAFVYHGRFTLKGFSERVRLYEVLWEAKRA